MHLLIFLILKVYQASKLCLHVSSMGKCELDLKVNKKILLEYNRMITLTSGRGIDGNENGENYD